MTSRKGRPNDTSEADVSKNDLGESLEEAELEELYAWVDRIPFSRPKKNISRDFSDGVMFAELLDHFFPNTGLIEMHNYTTANSTNKKKENWYYLNRKVFRKLNFELAEDVIADLVNSKQGTIEKVLCMLRIKIERAQYAVTHQSEKPEADQHQMSPGRGQKTIRVGTDTKGGKAKPMKTYEEYGDVITHKYLDMKGWNSAVEHTPISKSKFVRAVAESDVVSRLQLEECEQKCLAKTETIRILEAKINRLEHLLYLKDKRIDDLQARVESMRPTGIRR